MGQVKRCWLDVARGAELVPELPSAPALKTAAHRVLLRLAQSSSPALFMGMQFK